MQVIRISVGTFAGTQERLIVVPDEELSGFDLAHQGGGQN
jgi:hypothetical protein